ATRPRTPNCAALNAPGNSRSTWMAARRSMAASSANRATSARWAGVGITKLRTTSAPSVNCFDIERLGLGLWLDPFAQRDQHAFVRQPVGAFVQLMAGVALDPLPGHRVALVGGVQALPQVDVLDLALGGGL